MNSIQKFLYIKMLSRKPLFPVIVVPEWWKMYTDWYGIRWIEDEYIGKIHIFRNAIKKLYRNII